MAKEIKFDEEARRGLEAGVNKLARRGQGHARPEGPLRGPRQEVRRADDHERRRDDRQGDRARGQRREHGRPAGARKSRPRRTTSPVTARRPRPCSPRSWCAKVCATWRPARIRSPSSAASRRPSKPSSTQIHKRRQGDRGPGGDRRRRRHLRRRQGDRRQDRRGDEGRRQGRRHHRRGVADLRHRDRDRRGHAVRQGLHLAVHDHGPRSHGGRRSPIPTS